MPCDMHRGCPSALEDALARVGTYAGADVAVLVQYATQRRRRVGRIGSDALAENPMTRRCRTSVPMPSGSSAVGCGRDERGRAGAVSHAAWEAMADGAWYTPSRCHRKTIAGAIARSRDAVAASEAQRQIAHLGRVALSASWARPSHTSCANR